MYFRSMVQRRGDYKGGKGILRMRFGIDYIVNICFYPKADYTVHYLIQTI